MSFYSHIPPALPSVPAHRLLARTLAATAVLLMVACGTVSAPRGLDSPLTLAGQGSFFVGGRELKSETLSAVPGFSPEGTITVDQMYVRYQLPDRIAGRPIVLIHGCCLTGKTWESTPDGRMGWDEFFLRQGHSVYVIDQAARGRSAADPSAIVAARQGKLPSGHLPAIFSAGREGAWTIFRFGPAYPQTFPGMKYPLEAQAELWKQMVPDLSRALPNPNPTVPALSQLAGRIGGAVLLAHSQSGPYPFQAAALDRQGIAGIVSIEPVACPSATADMTPYKGLPILVLWGDYVNNSPFWAPRVKACGDFVRAASAAGAKAQMVMLADEGMPGQSHMLMQDRNSLQVAQWLDRWIAGHAPP
jgi:pimeloyl-ACP methyl ester carboxylesterase